MWHFKLRLNKRNNRLIKGFFVAFLVLSWFVSGWPAVWITPKSQFPPKVRDVKAATPTRVQQPTCGNGSATTIACTLTSTPVNGNALIAVIGTRGTSIGRVSSITQTGATWVKAIEVANASGATSEIWYALNVSGASTSVTINLAATLKASAIISEYSGLVAASALDVTATSTGSSASPVTGTTATTAQANELWVGGLNSAGTGTYSTPLNSFTLVANAQSTGGSGSTKNSAEYLDRVVTATGTANSGATITSAVWAGVIATFKGQSTTTIGSGTDPASATVVPGSAITDADAFTLATDFGTDSVTALTVTLAGAGTPYQGLAEVRITSDNGATLYFAAVTSFTSNTVNFSGGTPIPVSTTSTQFKVRITPLSHANMPVPPGASYALSPYVSALTDTNPDSGTDSMANTITIDNLSPNGATATSGSAGNTAVTLNWTTSNSSDFATTNGSVVLRWAAATAGAEVPAEGNTSYTAGSVIGTATAACVISSAASTAQSKIDGTGGSVGCTTAALTNGQAYTYKVFQVDTSGNYDVGVSIGTFTPAAAVSTFTQNKYRWYQDNNLADPTTAWGTPAIAENTAITVIPAGNNPPDTATALRLRVNYVVNTANLPISSNYFKLEFKAGTDGSCTTGTWTDVGTGAWAYGTSTVSDGSNITAVLSDTTAGLGEQYAKSKPTALNHVAATTTQIIEYDFHILGTSSVANTTYSFRVVGTNGTGSTETIFDAYTNCPTLTTRPGTADLMRHGNVFTNSVKQGFLWAN